MPDTPELQAAFGQPDRQGQGCGFPVAKLVAMFCWASGAVLDVAIGPYRSGELGLWHQLWDQLQAGDVALGERFYGAYAELAQLTARAVTGYSACGAPGPADSISGAAGVWARTIGCSFGPGPPSVRTRSRGKLLPRCQ